MRTCSPRLRGLRLLVSGLIVALAAAGLGDAGSQASAQPTRPAQTPGDGQLYQLAATPSSGLTDGQQIDVTITHSESVRVYLSQCTADVLDLDSGPDRVIDYCRVGDPAGVPAGTSVVPFTVRSSFVSTGGDQRSCAAGVPGDCVLYASTSAYAGASSLPIEFGPAQPYRVTVEPAADLVDGQEVEVTVTGHDRPLRLVQCTSQVIGTSYDMEILGEFCTGGNEPAVPGPGPGTATTAVARDFRSVLGYSRSCGDARGGCVLAVFELDGGVRGFSYAPIDFEPPARIVVDPEQHHHDGQRVRVGGAEIPDSYVGPPFWVFPTTGQWVLTQCGAGVGDDPTILGVFTDCAAPAGGGVVEVRGGLVDTHVVVRSAIASVLGDEIDCTPAGACVMALARVESDGEVTVLTAPLSFDGGPP
jgi:hypothetical protein